MSSQKDQDQDRCDRVEQFYQKRWHDRHQKSVPIDSLVEKKNEPASSLMHASELSTEIKQIEEQLEDRRRKNELEDVLDDIQEQIRDLLSSPTPSNKFFRPLSDLGSHSFQVIVPFSMAKNNDLLRADFVNALTDRGYRILDFLPLLQISHPVHDKSMTFMPLTKLPVIPTHLRVTLSTQVEW